MKNKVASGEFPDVIDSRECIVSLAAIEQQLVLDLKPFIDENNLQKMLVLNYEQTKKRRKDFHCSRTTIYNGTLV